MEFADGLNLVICNTLFTKQEAKLVTYVAGPVKSTIDYIMVRQEDKAKVRNVKVISSGECVPKHKLLVMDMWFEATKTWHRKFEPRVRVWKLKEEKICEEYICRFEIRPVCKWSLATDERYNDGICSGHMWNDKRTTQTQRNVVE